MKKKAKARRGQSAVASHPPTPLPAILSAPLSDASTGQKSSTTTSGVLTTFLAVIVPLLFSGFFNFYGNRVWVLHFPLVAVVILAAWIGYSHAFKRLSSPKRLTLTVLLAFTTELLGLFGIYHISNPVAGLTTDHAIKPAFSAKYTWTSGMSANGPDKWLVGGGEVFPIYFGFLVNFSNLGDVPLMIDSYVIENKAEHEEWQVISLPQGAGMGTIYEGENRKEVYQMNYTTLESVLANKNILPNETVRGWLFLSKPYLSGKLRLKVTDVFGKSYIEPLEGKQSSDGWNFQPLLMTPSNRGSTDISIIPFHKTAE